VRTLIPRASVERVRRVAEQEGSTLFGFALAAFQAYLHRLTGHRDFCVGFDLAGQVRHPGRDLVGHCVSFLPLRANVTPDQRFADLLRYVRGELLDAMDNQATTYGEILQRIPVSRDPARLPLVSVTFNLDPSGVGHSFGDLDVTMDSVPREFERNDLFVNMVELDDGDIDLQCTYNTDLFDRATVHRRMREFVHLMMDAVDDTSRPIDDLAWIPPDDLEELEGLWNGPSVTYPTDIALHDLIRERVSQSPDAVAVIAEAGSTDSLTYSELDRASDALATYLQDTGVRPDDRVAIAMERSCSLVVSLLAVLKSGGAYVPIDPSYPAARQRLMLEDSGATLILAQADPTVELPVPTLIVDDLLPTLPDRKPTTVVSGKGLAYVIYTSGSTGRPKGVMVEHRSIVNRLLWMLDGLAFSSNDAVLQKTPTSFDVSVWELFLPLISGGRVVMLRPEGHKEPASIIRSIQRHGITILHFVPSMLQLFLSELGEHSVSSLRAIVCSGEVLTPGIRDRAIEQTGVPLYNLYGPTEAAVDVTSCRTASGTPPHTVPIGRPIANTRLYVLDGRARPVPRGVPGELYIGGIQVARGYLGQPELTAERFVDDPVTEGGSPVFRTGDFGRIRADGHFEFIGRRDGQVKLRGFRIELGEVEIAIEQLTGVARAVVTYGRDDSKDDYLIGYYVPSDEELDATSLRRRLRSHLPEYMIPAHWVALTEIPLTPSGKVDRNALPIPLPGAVAQAVAPPRSSIEKAISTIWCEVLGIEEVSRDADFFEMGGHSILAVRAIARMRTSLEVDVNLVEFFSAPKLWELAEVVELRLSLEAITGNGTQRPGEETVF
jgi:amino acid adenylation domain-containing protein